MEPKKVTRAELDAAKERERVANEELARQRKLEQMKISENPEREGENPNVKMARMREEEGAVEARSVGEAIGCVAGILYCKLSNGLRLLKAAVLEIAKLFWLICTNVKFNF